MMFTTDTYSIDCPICQIGTLEVDVDIINIGRSDAEWEISDIDSECRCEENLHLVKGDYMMYEDLIYNAIESRIEL